MDKKIEETREFLQTIGMPKAQQADICCYVILAMAGIKPDMSWSEATNEWIRIHDIIQFVNTFYGMSYACLLYTSPSPRDRSLSRMPSSA